MGWISVDVMKMYTKSSLKYQRKLMLYSFSLLTYINKSINCRSLLALIQAVKNLALTNTFGVCPFVGFFAKHFHTVKLDIQNPDTV